jgi:hypothetical protein
MGLRFMQRGSDRDAKKLAGDIDDIKGKLD